MSINERKKRMARFKHGDIVYCKKNFGTLAAGQAVLIFNPTDSVIHSITGKEIGKREDIVGIGIIEKRGRKSYVRLSDGSGTMIPIKYLRRIGGININNGEANNSSQRTFIKPIIE